MVILGAQPFSCSLVASITLGQLDGCRSVIAIWLGHESVETTQIYLDANLALKDESLGKPAQSQSRSARSIVWSPEANDASNQGWTAGGPNGTHSGARIAPEWGGPYLTRARNCSIRLRHVPQSHAAQFSMRAVLWLAVSPAEGGCNGISGVKRKLP